MKYGLIATAIVSTLIGGAAAYWFTREETPAEGTEPGGEAEPETTEEPTQTEEGNV